MTTSFIQTSRKGERGEGVILNSQSHTCQSILAQIGPLPPPESQFPLCVYLLKNAPAELASCATLGDRSECRNGIHQAVSFQVRQK